MNRSVTALIVGAIVVSMMLAGAGIAGAAPAALSARTMARSYVKTATIVCTHMSETDLANARAAKCSYRSIAASHGVDSAHVVKIACTRAQAVVNQRVRRHLMTRTAARKFMRNFRTYCVEYLDSPTTGSVSSVTPPATPGISCPNPSAPCVGPTPTASAPVTCAAGTDLSCSGSSTPCLSSPSTPSTTCTMTAGMGTGMRP